MKELVDVLKSIDEHPNLKDVLSSYRNHQVPSSNLLSGIDPELGSKLEEIEISAPYLLMEDNIIPHTTIKQLKNKGITVSRAESDDIYRYYLVLNNFSLPVSGD